MCRLPTSNRSASSLVGIRESDLLYAFSQGVSDPVHRAALHLHILRLWDLGWDCQREGQLNHTVLVKKSQPTLLPVPQCRTERLPNVSPLIRASSTPVTSEFAGVAVSRSDGLANLATAAPDLADI